jgi:hypothetical protein
MRGAVAWILGIALAANGFVMLGAPAAWYAAVPGVAATGPFNAHFIRDIGVAYVLCGASLPWFAISPAARPAAVIGAAFLALHNGRPSLGCVSRAGARASTAHRSPARLSAAGPGDLDRLAAARPRPNCKQGSRT